MRYLFKCNIFVIGGCHLLLATPMALAGANSSVRASISSSSETTPEPAVEPEVELDSIGASCGEGRVQFEAERGKESWIRFTNFAVSASRGQTRQRVNCTVTFKVKVAEGYQWARENLFASGHADIGENGSAQLIIRYYPVGESSETWRERFTEVTDKDFSVDTGWKQEWFPCNKSLSMTVMVDLTAYQKVEESTSESPTTTIRLHAIKVPPIAFRKCYDGSITPSLH